MASAEYQREWRKKNPDKVRSSNAARKDAVKAWHEKNKDRKKSTQKVWNDNNRIKLNNIRKTWELLNPEKAKASRRAWVEANPDRVKLIGHKRRAKMRGATATLTLTQWQETWQEFNGKCFWCRKVATCMEHIVPIQPRPGNQQGHHTKSNVVPSCQPCNSSKLNKDPLVFLFETRKNEQ